MEATDTTDASKWENRVDETEVGEMMIHEFGDWGHAGTDYSDAHFDETWGVLVGSLIGCGDRGEAYAQIITGMDTQVESPMFLFKMVL